MKLKAPWSFGTTQTTTWHHISEDLNPQQHYCENLKSSVSVKNAVFLAVTACILMVRYLSVWKLLYIMFTDSKYFTLVKWYLSTKPHGTASQNVAVFRTMTGHSVKVKFTLEQAMKAQRGSRGVALLFL